MALRAREGLIGAWSFLIGVVLAVSGGIALSMGGEANPIILVVLSLLGLTAGFFVHVNDKEATTFLLASVSLVIVSFAGQQGITNVAFGTIRIGQLISSTLAGLLVLLVPATIVVSLKTLFIIANR